MVGPERERDASAKNENQRECAGEGESLRENRARNTLAVLNELSPLPYRVTWERAPCRSSRTMHPLISFRRRNNTDCRCSCSRKKTAVCSDVGISRRSPPPLRSRELSTTGDLPVYQTRPRLMRLLPHENVKSRRREDRIDTIRTRHVCIFGLGYRANPRDNSRFGDP